MKCFLAYRVTDADYVYMKALLLSIRKNLRNLKIDTYSVLLDYIPKDASNSAEYMDDAFKNIDQCDFLLVIQNYDEKSEGMLMEVGYCIAKNIPVIIAQKSSIQDSYLKDMTNFNIIWQDETDLIKQLDSYNYKNLFQSR